MSFKTKVAQCPAVFQTVLDPGFIAVYNLFYSSQPVLALGGTLFQSLFYFFIIFYFVPWSFCYLVPGHRQIDGFRLKRV